MNSKIAFVLSLALLSGFSTTEALLPPLYESINEVKAILESKELSEKFPSGDMILKIERTEEGFKVVSNYRTVEVNVTYNKTAKIGPAEFNLKFSSAVPNSDP